MYYPPLLARCLLSRITPVLAALALYRCVVYRLSLSANFRLSFCVDFPLNFCVDLCPTTSAYCLVCFVVLLDVEWLACDYQFIDSPYPDFGVDFFVLALAGVLLTFLLLASLTVCVVCVVS